ncbi:MAG: thioredoxin fold domain-containing protein [Sulfurovum sp.]|nr:thioredoxin fold domain-containing protein [Sulfurovum sp.]
MFHSLMTALVILLFFSSPLFSDTDNMDIDQLALHAKKENKHLLLFFHKDGCSFCEKMRYVTLDDDTIEDMIDAYFILVDINIDEEGSIHHHDFNGSKHEYAKSLEIGFYPTVGFIDGNNSIVYGAIGYQDIETFSILLKYIYSGNYKIMEWEDFQSKMEFESED